MFINAIMGKTSKTTKIADARYFLPLTHKIQRKVRLIEIIPNLE